MDLAKVDASERKNANRKGVLDKVTSYAEEEPWPGYDELTAKELRRPRWGQALAPLDRAWESPRGATN